MDFISFIQANQSLKDQLAISVGRYSAYSVNRFNDIFESLGYMIVKNNNYQLTFNGVVQYNIKLVRDFMNILRD